MILLRRNAGNSILTRKFRLCKSAEKNCPETGSYYSGPAYCPSRGAAHAALPHKSAGFFLDPFEPSRRIPDGDPLPQKSETLGAFLMPGRHK